MEDVLIKRLKSLCWRAGMMALATFISVIANNLGIFEFSPTVTAVAGLILGEVSKALNSKAV